MQQAEGCHRAEVPKEHKSRGSEGGRGAEIVCWCLLFICLFFLLFIVGVLGGLSGVFVRGLGWGLGDRAVMSASLAYSSLNITD